MWPNAGDKEIKVMFRSNNSSNVSFIIGNKVGKCWQGVFDTALRSL